MSATEVRSILNPLKKSAAEEDEGSVYQSLPSTARGDPTAEVCDLMRQHELAHPVPGPELVKLVKESYKYVSANPSENSLLRSLPLESRAQSRTLHQFGYLSDPVDASWETQYSHFQKVLKSGHFSLIHKPYETLGDIVTDTRSLFLQHFDEYVSVKLLEKMRNRIPTALRKPEGKEEHSSASEEALCEVERREKDCQHAGLSHIRQLLAESGRRIIATRAGQPYASHVNQCQLDREEKSRQEEQIGDEHMVLQHLSHTDLLHPHCTGPITLSNVRKSPSDIDDEFSGSRVKNKGLNRAELRDWKKEQKLSKLNKKLEYIYHVLCSLYNLKTRYLRNKIPLSEDIVKALRRNPFAGRKAQDYNQRGENESRFDMKGPSGIGLLESHRDRQGSFFHGGGGGMTSSRRMSITTSSNIPNLLTMISTLSGARKGSIFGSGAIPNLSGTSPSKKGMGAKNRILAALSNVQDNKLETWEDLMNVGNKNRMVRMMRKNLLPPWQTPIQNHEPVKSSKEKDEAHLEDYHPEGAVNRLRAGHLATKERIIKNLKQDIDKVDRERMVKFRYKMLTMQEVIPLYEVQQEVLKQVTREAVRDPVLITEETVPWYDALIQEVTQLGLRSESSVCEWLAKIEKFVLEDLHHIPSVKEKLCLITLSLPIYEICTPHVQYAIQFVLVEVLDGNLQMLEEWQQYRRLYLIK